MIAHIAIYKFKAGTSEEAINQVLLEVRALRNKVPELNDILVGKNYNKWNEGYTHAIVVLAESQAALDAYRAHPDHEKVAEILDKMEDKGIGIDFEDMK